MCHHHPSLPRTVSFEKYFGLIRTEIKQGTGDLHKDAVTSEKELDVVVELRDITDKMQGVLGNYNIED